MRAASTKLNSNEENARKIRCEAHMKGKLKRMFRIAGEMPGKTASICALGELACQKLKKRKEQKTEQKIEELNKNK